jgi:hypothetical protein
MISKEFCGYLKEVEELDDKGNEETLSIAEGD